MHIFLCDLVNFIQVIICKKNNDKSDEYHVLTVLYQNQICSELDHKLTSVLLETFELGRVD